MENKMMLGKPVADWLTDDVIKRVDILRKKNIEPKLAILKVGNRPEDEAYQKGALSRMQKCNIDVEMVELDKDCSQEDYIVALEKLNESEDVHGILCFRPLPGKLNENEIKNKINPEKDIDCFSPINMAKLFAGEKDGFAPCTPMAVIEMLRYNKINLTGKKIVVLGRSMVVGKPLSILLLNENATVTICHSKTKDIEKISSEADVLVTCMGRPRMVGCDFIKKDAVVIDVGINFDKEGNMCGDVDFDSVLDKCSMITPVPRGVGGVTTSVLARQLIDACEK